MKSIGKVPMSTDTNTPDRPTGVANVTQLGIEFNSPADQLLDRAGLGELTKSEVAGSL